MQSKSSFQHAEVSDLQLEGLSQVDTDALTIPAEQLHTVSTHTEEKDGLPNVPVGNDEGQLPCDALAIPPDSQHKVSSNCVKEGEVVANSSAGACDKTHDVCQANADAPIVDQEDLTPSHDVVPMPITIMAMHIAEKTCCVVLDINGLLLTRNRLFKCSRGKRYVPKAGFEDRYLVIEPRGLRCTHLFNTL